MHSLKSVFYCIDDIGMSREVGQWLIVSVKSVLANTSLNPIILYTGKNDDSVAKLRTTGAEVKLCESRMHQQVRKGIEAGIFPQHMAGALLRYEIDLLDTDDDYVMYADCDTYFFSNPAFDLKMIDTVGACVTSRNDGKPHFNSGIIVFNVANYREETPTFFEFIENTLGNWLPSSIDERMFNAYFGSKIAELPPRVNWRPFFGFNPDVDVVHFHGFQLTHTIFMMTRDYRGFEKSLLDSDLLPEMAIHRAKTIVAAEKYFSIISSRGGLEGTDLLDLFAKLAELTDKQKLCGSLMLSNAQIGKACWEALKLAHLVESPNSSSKKVVFPLGQHADVAHYQIHPCKNFGTGKMIIRDPGKVHNFSIFSNEAIEFKKRVHEDHIDIYWAGIGIDCHFVLFAPESSPELTVEILDLTNSACVVTANFKSNESVAITPNTF